MLVTPTALEVSWCIRPHHIRLDKELAPTVLTTQLISTGKPAPFTEFGKGLGKEFSIQD